MIQFDHALVLLGLPLAVLPLLPGRRTESLVVPSLERVPHDLASAVLDWARRVAAALAIATTLLSLAGPHRAEERIERIGQGAEIVLVLDRSRSMDAEPSRGTHNLIGQAAGYSAESKSAAARRVVSQFVAQRPHDAFGLVLFSTEPIAFLPFTQKQAVIQAALSAATVGKGLGDTDIGRAMEAAARYFEARPYVGSRLLLLISDGGARLDDATRVRLGRTLKQSKVGVYWLYLVGRWGRHLVLNGPMTDAERDSLPEQSLHQYLAGLGLPYRVYEADDPQAIQQAIDDLARIEQHPIQFTETVPRRDLMPWTLGAAWVAVLLWLGSQALVRRSWA